MKYFLIKSVEKTCLQFNHLDGKMIDVYLFHMNIYILHLHCSSILKSKIYCFLQLLNDNCTNVLHTWALANYLYLHVLFLSFAWTDVMVIRTYNILNKFQSNYLVWEEINFNNCIFSMHALSKWKSLPQEQMNLLTFIVYATFWFTYF